MISSATTVHQDGHGAEVRHSPQRRERRTTASGWTVWCSTAAGRSATPAEHAIAFGPFRLFPARRLLLEGEKPVRLGSRAFDILVALVERAGELVTKTELMARVWPSTFVEESNLKVQVAGLRRVSGRSAGAAVSIWPPCPAAATASWRRSLFDGRARDAGRVERSAQSAGSRSRA